MSSYYTGLPPESLWGLGTAAFVLWSWFVYRCGRREAHRRAIERDDVHEERESPPYRSGYDTGLADGIEAGREWGRQDAHRAIKATLVTFLREQADALEGVDPTPDGIYYLPDNDA